MESEIKTKIMFELEEPTIVKIMRKGKQIGRIWSQDDLTFGDKDIRPNLPYPHDENKSYCQNSIQICGFDKQEGPWACGPYRGKFDCVLHFMPVEDKGDKYYQQKIKDYEQYVGDFFTAQIKNVEVNGVKKWDYAHTQIIKDVTKLLNFRDYCAMHI